MNTKNIFLSLCGALALSGCFEDEGNYTYLPESAPKFLFSSPNRLNLYEGDSAKMKGAFRFESVDSLERMADLSYEWKVRGVVLSTEKDFNMATADVMELLHLTEYPRDLISGTYTVIENATGLHYIAPVLYGFIPRYGVGNWMILSKNGGQAKLSYQRLIKKTNGTKVDSTFENSIGIFQTLNGEAIPGIPRKLIDHGAPYISPYSGATLVLTDQVAYEINNEKLTKARDLKDEFLNGTPSNFSIVDAFYVEQITFLAAEDGRLFRRVLSQNYLGGKFITEPYEVDSKGCELDFFANGQSRNWSDQRLAYDRKNHRVLSITQRGTPRGAVMLITPAGTGHVVTPWDLGEDAEVLAISEKGEESMSPWSAKLFRMIYNKAGKTYIADFVLDSNPPTYYASAVNNSYVKLYESPVTLTKENKILITAYLSAGTYAKHIFYTKGNELRYIDCGNNRQEGLFMTFTHKISAIHYDISSNRHKEFGVGLVNGDFMRVNIRDKNKPSIIQKSVFNVGGEIVDVSNTGTREYNVE